MQVHHDCSLDTITFSPPDVFKALANLDPAKAMGADGIGPRVLKMCATALCEPLCHLFSASVANSCIPSEWKVHCVTPIHKSGDKSIVSNYRPISLLSCVSKVLERLIYNNIIDYVSPFISIYQFGFSRGRSTLQQLLIFLSDIFHNIDDKLQTDAIYLDLRKAFDSVPHDKLLVKLYSIGITGELWEWFKSYLSSRTQCVSISGTLSNTLPVTSGVPQGSILGPLLFLIFINDIPSLAQHISVLLYADDTKCYHPISQFSDSLNLQADLDSLTQWSEDNNSIQY